MKRQDTSQYSHGESYLDQVASSILEAILLIWFSFCMGVMTPLGP